MCPFEALAAKLEDMNAEGFLRTVRAFNAAVASDPNTTVT